MLDFTVDNRLKNLLSEGEGISKLNFFLKKLFSSLSDYVAPINWKSKSIWPLLHIVTNRFTNGIHMQGKKNFKKIIENWLKSLNILIEFLKSCDIGSLVSVHHLDLRFGIYQMITSTFVNQILDCHVVKIISKINTL